MVICDRFADSTVVYQGYERELKPSLLRQLNDTAVQGLWPDATVLLDLAPEQGLRRALTRNMRENKLTAEGHPVNSGSWRIPCTASLTGAAACWIRRRCF